MTEEDITRIIVMLVTAAVGYFIVSKTVDFFKRGKVREEKVPPGVKDLSNPKEEDDDPDTIVIP